MRASTHHQEVCFGISAIEALAEDTAVAQILRQRHAQVRIIQETEVVGLSRVRRAHLARPDLELRLSQASSLDEDLICIVRDVSDGRVGVVWVADATYDSALGLPLVEDCGAPGACAR